MFCIYCGARRNPRDVFCLACGQKFSAVPEPEPAPGHARQSPPETYPYPAQAYAGPPEDPHPEYGVSPRTKRTGGNIALLLALALTAVGLLSVGIGLMMRSSGHPDVPAGTEDAFQTPPPDASAPPAREPEGGYLDYELLLDDYFIYFERGDASQFYRFLHDSVREALGGADIARGEYAYELDVWSEDYGARVVSREISGIYPYTEEEYESLSEFLGIGRASLEQYIDVEVQAEYMLDGFRESVAMDFKLMQTGGQWYIVEVW